jgi:hypothetical protein
LGNPNGAHRATETLANPTAPQPGSGQIDNDPGWIEYQLGLGYHLLVGLELQLIQAGIEAPPQQFLRLGSGFSQGQRKTS